MAKKLHRSVRPQVEIRSSDELAIFTDEELGNRMSFIFSELDRLGIYRSQYTGDWVLISPEAKSFEIELSYVMREFEIRAGRKNAHRRYVDALRAEDAREAAREYTLPEYQGNPPPSYWS